MDLHIRDFPPRLKAELKARAALLNTSLRDLIIKTLGDSLADPDYWVRYWAEIDEEKRKSYEWEDQK